MKNNPKCILINSAKSEIRIVSKEYIDSISRIIRDKTNVNQLRNTDPVVTWFQNIENEQIALFVKLDIINFYPCISKDLLMNAVNFAKSITPIDDKIITTTLHDRKLLLPHKK